MKVTFNFLCLVCFLTLMSSCKKDVEGCSDPKSDNYNPDATINTGCKYSGCTDKDAENYNPQANVSTECIFARDKFIGKYDGTLGCAQDLALISGMTSFTIDENITGGKNDVTILISTTTGIIVPITGTCSGNTLTIEATVKDVNVNLGGTVIKTDIIAKGTVTYDATKKELSGPLSLEVKLPIGPSLKDTCPIVGIKK